MDTCVSSVCTHVFSQLILDVDSIRRGLPQVVEAFFGPESGLHADELAAVHDAFLRKYHVDKIEQYPLLSFHRENWEAPFHLHPRMPD
jgi:hypothetical protein